MLTFQQLSTLLLLSLTSTIESFTVHNHASRLTITSTTTSKSNNFSTELKSFYSDSSDYKSSDSDFDSDEESASELGVPVNAESDEEDVPTIEETPVPMSKNSGSRFVAFVFDKMIYSGDKEMDIMDFHEDRIKVTEDHVMFCRKANLYNETFNTESMADVLWSHQM